MRFDDVIERIRRRETDDSDIAAVEELLEAVRAAASFFRQIEEGKIKHFSTVQTLAKSWNEYHGTVLGVPARPEGEKK